MKKLIKKIEERKKSPLKRMIENRIKEFIYFREKGSNEEIFSELCFCFLTANFQAEKSWKIQKDIGEGFWEFSLIELEKELKSLGHRFWPQRAKRIFDARWAKETIKSKIKEIESENEIRTWLVKNFKGLGMKESSHFMRNIGFFDVAIIDKHIINLLVEENLIERPKTLTTKKYIEIENLLKKIANKTNLTLGELDLYLWYEKTGKILK